MSKELDWEKELKTRSSRGLLDYASTVGFIRTLLAAKEDALRKELRDAVPALVQDRLNTADPQCWEPAVSINELYDLGAEWTDALIAKAEKLRNELD